MRMAPSDHPRAPRASALPPDERRAMIVEATLPLLLENGEMVTTRQIADAAGIAEGTIFRVFADKEAVIAAVLEAALDPAPLERAIAAVDPTVGLDAALKAAVTIIQQRVVDTWRLFSSVGPRYYEPSRRPPVVIDALVALLDAHRDRLAMKPVAAARLLRALTLSVTHPMLGGEPTSPATIVRLFLHGVSAPEPTC
ncbi:MAG TPA: TetR/AcrR family transcriptional regulator [Acidimicrobiales bacterium]